MKENSIEELIQMVINSYIENDILRLDVSDTTKNRLKRDLRKKFRDEDFIYDIKNNIGLIPKSKIKAKIEQLKMNANYDWMYKYDYQDVVKMLQELLEEGE